MRDYRSKTKRHEHMIIGATKFRAVAVEVFGQIGTKVISGYTAAEIISRLEVLACEDAGQICH